MDFKFRFDKKKPVIPKTFPASTDIIYFSYHLIKMKKTRYDWYKYAL